MMWPFKWKLSACTFTWCYLFVKIFENEIWKFGRNLPLATFGSERVKTRHYSTYLLLWLRKLWAKLLIIMMQVTVTNKGHSAVSTVRDSISVDEWLGDSEDPHSTTTVSWMTIESFRFEDEDDYEYEIFPIISSARAWTSGKTWSPSSSFYNGF